MYCVSVRMCMKDSLARKVCSGCSVVVSRIVCIGIFCMIVFLEILTRWEGYSVLCKRLFVRVGV